MRKANYRITGNQKSYTRNLYAAAMLSSRYHIDGQYIRAWNGEGTVAGWSIIVDVQRAIKAEIKKMFSNPMSEINVKVFENLTEELEGIRIELEEAVQEIDWYKQHFDHSSSVA